MNLSAWRGTKGSDQQPERNERQARRQQDPDDVLDNADAVTRRQLLDEGDGRGKRQTSKDETPEHAPRITRTRRKYQLSLPKLTHYRFRSISLVFERWAGFPGFGLRLC